MLISQETWQKLLQWNKVFRARHTGQWFAFRLKSILYGESVLCRSKYVKVNKRKRSESADFGRFLFGWMINVCKNYFR